MVTAEEKSSVCDSIIMTKVSHTPTHTNTPEHTHMRAETGAHLKPAMHPSENVFTLRFKALVMTVSEGRGEGNYRVKLRS